MFLFTKWGNKASDIQISLVKTNIDNGNRSTCQVVLMKKSITFNSLSVQAFFFPVALLDHWVIKPQASWFLLRPLSIHSFSTPAYPVQGLEGWSLSQHCIGQEAGYTLERSHIDRETLVPAGDLEFPVHLPYMLLTPHRKARVDPAHHQCWANEKVIALLY